MDLHYAPWMVDRPEGITFEKRCRLCNKPLSKSGDWYEGCQEFDNKSWCGFYQIEERFWEIFKDNFEKAADSASKDNGESEMNTR